MEERDSELEYLLLSHLYPKILEILESLRAMGDRVTQYLLRMLDDPSDERRGRAAARLGELGAVQALDPLIRLASLDDCPNVRSSALYALCCLGEAAMPFALSLLSSEDADDRVNGALLLHDIAHPDSVDALVKAVHDPYWQVRGEAALALSAIGGATAIEAIMAASHDDDAVVREHAVVALMDVGGPAARARLHELLDDPAPSVRSEIMDLGFRPDEG